MPVRFRHLSFALCASALVLSGIGRAQQSATTTAPSTAPTAPAAPAKAASPALTSPKDAANKLIADAARDMTANNVDGALNNLSQSIKLYPNNEDAYIYRASIYYQKKLWSQAEDDFKTAAQIAPKDPIPKFNLIEIKFVQKKYDEARPGFAALEKDPDMGDFASYKVFLCDLFGGHEDAAKKELDDSTSAMNGPSCEFSNAAWNLFYKKLDGDNGARYWLLRASRIYPPQKNAYYAQSLQDLGYLPIPGPDDKVTPPAAGTTSHP